MEYGVAKIMDMNAALDIENGGDYTRENSL